MTEDQPPRILMTGATGFLGHFVLRELLRRGQHVVAMLRPPVDESLARLTTMMKQVGADADPHLQSRQLQIVEGGLPDSLSEPVWGRTATVVNCAASLQLFSDSNGEPFKTNVDGTRAIIDWAQRHGVETV